MSHGAGFENVVRALNARGARLMRSGGGYVTQCPAHEDRSPSLSVGQGAGKAVMKCHAGCDTPDVMLALGLNWPDLFDNGGSQADRERIAADLWMPCNGMKDTPAEDRCSGHKAAEYRYTDENGRFLFAACRCSRKGDGCKRAFAQWQPDEGSRSGKRWSLQGVRRVIYHLPDVVKAVREGRRIWITEGEKDADRLKALGEVATSAPMGAGSWLKEYARYFRGAAEVVIVVDCDEPGLEHAGQVYADVVKFAKSVRAVCTPVDAKGADASDHLDYGLGLDDFEPVFFEYVEPRPRMVIQIEKEHREKPVVFEGFSQSLVERSLVGSMIAFGHGYRMAASDLITDKRLGAVVQAAVKLAVRGAVVAPETVAVEIEEMGNGSYESVLRFLTELEKAAFSDPSKAQVAARILRERSLRREIAFMCRAIEAAIRDERRTIEEVLESLGMMATRQREEFAQLDEYCAPVGDVFTDVPVKEVGQDNVRKLPVRTPEISEEEIEEALADASDGGAGEVGDRAGAAGVSGGRGVRGGQGAAAVRGGGERARSGRGGLGVVSAVR